MCQAQQLASLIWVSLPVEGGAGDHCSKPDMTADDRAGGKRRNRQEGDYLWLSGCNNSPFLLLTNRGCW